MVYELWTTLPLFSTSALARICDEMLYLQRLQDTLCFLLMLGNLATQCDLHLCDLHLDQVSNVVIQAAT